MTKKPLRRKGFSALKYFKQDNIYKTTVYFELLERQQAVVCNLVVDCIFDDDYEYYTIFGDNNSHKFTGKAICHEDDTFDLTLGMDIALNNAIAKFYTYTEKCIRKHTRKTRKVLFQLDDLITGKHLSMLSKKQYKLR